MIIHCSCLSMPCHLGAYTVDLMTDSSALLQASSCSLGSEDVLGGTPQVQVLHQGRPRARQNFHLCPGHKHPNSKQFGEQQNRIKTGSKQDKQGPAQQSRCTTRNLLRRVLPPGLLKQDKAQRWQRTWKNCGNSAFPGTFQKDSGRQLVSADWPRLACTTGEALSDLPSRKLTTQATHQDHPNGFGQCRSGSPPSISQLCKVSDELCLSTSLHVSSTSQLSVLLHSCSVPIQILFPKCLNSFSPFDTD